MRLLFLAALAALSGCSSAATESVDAQTPAVVATTEVQIPAAPLPHTPPVPVGGKLVCSASAMQGGAVLCLTDPDAPLALNGADVARADASGVAVIGLRRDETSPAVVSFSNVQKLSDQRPFAVAYPVQVSVEVTPRKDDMSTLEMACNKIAPQSEDEKRRASESWLKKDAAFKSFHAPLGPVALARPVAATEQQYSISSFGKTRTYKPKTNDCKATVNVHNGTDIAVPTGTEIRAPMAGTVLLADPDLYYEGGAVFLDLGRGLVSVTMHMSRIDVANGQVVKQGDLLGLSGATGRVTGPHVHWGIKYRNVFETDRGTDIWLDPMQLLTATLPAPAGIVSGQ